MLYKQEESTSIPQHPGDAQLKVDELHDMWEEKERGCPTKYSTKLQVFVASVSTGLDNAAMHLISMVDTLGLPTIFFAYSAADLQWPELARLICSVTNPAA